MSISDKRFWRYQGDKVLIWRKKIKDGRHMTRIFFWTFWKIDAGLDETVQKQKASPW